MRSNLLSLVAFESSIAGGPFRVARGNCICKTGEGREHGASFFDHRDECRAWGSGGMCTARPARLDLRGWVRNTEEGDVEVVASGNLADLAELRASLRSGPRGSRVDHVIEHYLEDREAAGLDAFRIEGAW